MNKHELNRKIKKKLFGLWSFWPPFFGAGIQVKRISNDFKEVDVRLKHRFWNSNFVGTSFGGSLFAMTDAFYMVMLYELMGPGYIVWDKSARIEYKKPGTKDVWAYFRLTDDLIQEFQQKVEELGKYEPEFKIDITDNDNNVIAVVYKTLYIRKHKK